jgi:hypothetical protein
LLAGDPEPCHWEQLADARSKKNPEGWVFLPGCMGGAAAAGKDDPIENCTCPENSDDLPREIERLKEQRDRINRKLQSLRQRLKHGKQTEPPAFEDFGA